MPSRKAAQARGAHEARERVVHATSDDGYVFSGLLCEPALASPLLVLWVHGLHIGFAAPEYVKIARAVAADGVAFLSAETRGHDFGAWIRGASGARLAGSAWEIFSECIADLDGWLRAAQELGYREVVLAGHGFGAAKVVFYMAERRDERVRGIVAASSGTLIRDRLDPQMLDRAKTMVAEGRGQDLLPWGTRIGSSLPSTVSAQVYLGRERVQSELYGQGDLPPALSRITCPLLAWFGELETGRPDRDVGSFLETIRRDARQSPLVQTRIIKGGVYLYSGVETAVARELVRWAAQVRGNEPATRRTPAATPAGKP